MKIVLVSTPDKFKSEINTVIHLLENGLEIFHLRKSKFSRRKTIEYLRKVPEEYHNRIVLHAHFHLALKFQVKGIHLSKKQRSESLKARFKLWWLKFRAGNLQITTSFHSVLSLLENHDKFDYVILSPVFNSSTKLGLGDSFAEGQLKKTLENSPHIVYALGGVMPDKIDELKESGFGGAVLSGLIWESKSQEKQLEAFQTFKDLVEEHNRALP